MILKKIKGVHLNGHKAMSLNQPINNYLSPNKIYLPIVNGNIIQTKLVEVGQNVLMGQKVLMREGRFGHPVCSPVSGKVTNIVKMWHSCGKMVEMIEITNDMSERKVEDFGKPLENLTKENIIERIKNAGIVGLGGAGFPTYIKYQPEANAEVLIINAAECEPYITADYVLIKEKTQELIQGIKYMMIACGAKNAKIAIKKSKKEAIEVLNTALTNEPEIELFLLKDVYPAGWEKFIVEAVVKKTYNSLPSEVGAVVNNVQTAIAVCEAVEQNKPLIEKVVTITGDGILNPQNVRVKIGTVVEDVIKTIGGYTQDMGPAYFIAGGPMTGRSIMFDNLVITSNLGSVIVKKKDEHQDNPACLGCGKCSEKCPAHLTPTEIKNAFEASDEIALAKLHAEKCVQCGLCSYVCPSRIEMTEYVGKAKDFLAKANMKK